MSRAIQKVENSITLKTQRATDMLLVLQEEGEVRALVRQFVHEQMVQGTDYGVIPGTKEPTLLKPGAEKLFDLFRCKPEYEVMVRTVDIVSGLYSYEIRCKAVGRESGIVMNEGMGSASSYESRYRYRNAGRSCPSCGKQTLVRSKFKKRSEPEGTPPCWWCNAKNGGCGTEFSHDDPAVVKQETGKITNPDLADVANTVLKIAKKRAQVDCAIGLARVSDLFTQDLDDLPVVTVAESPAEKLVKAVRDRPEASPSSKPVLAPAAAPGPDESGALSPGIDPPAMEPEVVEGGELDEVSVLKQRILACTSRSQMLVLVPEIKKLHPSRVAEIRAVYAEHQRGLDS
jgi:hypothetical protein